MSNGKDLADLRGYMPRERSAISPRADATPSLQSGQLIPQAIRHDVLDCWILCCNTSPAPLPSSTAVSQHVSRKDEVQREEGHGRARYFVRNRGIAFPIRSESPPSARLLVQSGALLEASALPTQERPCRLAGESGSRRYVATKGLRGSRSHDLRCASAGNQDRRIQSLAASARERARDPLHPESGNHTRRSSRASDLSIHPPPLQRCDTKAKSQLQFAKSITPKGDQAPLGGSDGMNALDGIRRVAENERLAGYRSKPKRQVSPERLGRRSRSWLSGQRGAS